MTEHVVTRGVAVWHWGQYTVVPTMLSFGKPDPLSATGEAGGEH